MKTGFKEALSRRPQLGIFNMYAAPGIIERIGPDWDWVWIDGQHGQLDYTDIIAAVRACDLMDIYSVVRVPGHDQGFIGKVLDTAPDAIMVPMVDTAAQAAAIVQSVKFPPLGKRSFGGRRPINLLGRKYAHPDQSQPMLVCQIETRDGLENVKAISATPGVDAVVFGRDDLAMCDRLPMDKPQPEGVFDQALADVADAAGSNDTIAGGVFTTAPALRQALSLGYRLISGGADAAFLAATSRNQAQLRNCIAGFATENQADGDTPGTGVY